MEKVSKKLENYFKDYLSYLFLFLAILCEVVGTLLLPASQSFTKLTPTISLCVLYLFAFYFLSITVNTIPVAVMYATWSGLGIFTIAIISYYYFNQSLSWQAVLGLVLIVLGVALVNAFK
tara:strand:+ start:139 stop:498 length:360 start_codon:yes stop_codon:yes gene_type:complete